MLFKWRMIAQASTPMATQAIKAVAINLFIMSSRGRGVRLGRIEAQNGASAPPRPRSIAPRIAAGADMLTADRLPARCRPAGLPPGVIVVPGSEELHSLRHGCSPACSVDTKLHRPIVWIDG